MWPVMGLIDKLTKKIAKTASTAVTDSVKEEAKNVAVGAFPIVVGIGLAIAGLVIFKSSTPKVVKAVSVPAIRTTTMITHNWFLDDAAKAEVITRLIKQQSL
jgi:hypothetical protein